MVEQLLARHLLCDKLVASVVKADRDISDWRGAADDGDGIARCSGRAQCSGGGNAGRCSSARLLMIAQRRARRVRERERSAGGGGRGVATSADACAPAHRRRLLLQGLAGIPGISDEMAMQIQQIAFEVKKQRDEDARNAREQAAQAAAIAAAQTRGHAPSS